MRGTCFKRIMSAIIAGLMMFAVGCSNAGGGNTNQGITSADEVEFWSTYATEKVLQDQHIYSDIKLACEIDVLSAKHNNQSAQIILTAKKNVGSYNAVASDLVLVNGTDKIDASNITLYHQKYIEVVKIQNFAKGTPTGFYPDALVPLEAIVNSKENTIKSNQNQAIWVDIYVPQTVSAGRYTGSITVTYEGFVRQVPVSVTVLDFAVSEVTHSKSVFLNQGENHWGELDGSQRMLDIYNAELSKYRLSTWHFVAGINQFTEEDIPFFVEQAYAYAVQDVNSTLSVPYANASVDGIASFNKGVLKKTLKALIDKSIQTDYNLLSKAVVYFASLIDEPQLSKDREARLPRVCNDFKQALIEVAQELENDASITHSLKAEIAQSVRKIPNIVTTEYSPEYAPYVDTWCPQPQSYEIASNRMHYANQEEKWWYTCTEPKAPRPSYHTEDNLYSARLLSWMAVDYGVVGNLYWETNLYANINGTPIEDYYGTANRYTDQNGDGYLFYPGKRYGIDAPVPSIRLLAIRDGNEDYEMLYDLKTQYKQISQASGYPFDYTGVMGDIFQSLYNGTQISTTSEKFLQIRKTVMELENVLNSSAKMCVLSKEEKGGVVTIKATTLDGFDLYSDGEKLEAYTISGSGENKIRIYTITKTLGAGANSVVLSVLDGTNKSVTFNLGGGIETHSPSQLNGSYSVNVGSVSLETVNQSQYILASFAQASSNVTQTLTLNNAFLKNIGRNTDRISIDMYNPAGEVNIVIAFEYTTDTIYSVVYNGKLPTGTSSITIYNIYGFNWKVNKELKNIRFIVGAKGDDARNVYVGNLYVYNA